MPKVGDRVVVEGSKVGGARREGTLLKIVGSMIQVRWSDGSETLFSPGAGTVQYSAGNGKAAKSASKPDAKSSGKKSAPKKDAKKKKSKK
ncbi:MAG: DUF1918 domain-containing protein [Actinomycetota bacterium]